MGLYITLCVTLLHFFAILYAVSKGCGYGSPSCSDPNADTHRSGATKGTPGELLLPFWRQGKATGFADLYPPAYSSQLERESCSATAFGRYFLLSISHREIQEHPVLQDPRVKRSSDAAFSAFFLLCGQILHFLPICALKQVFFSHFECTFAGRRWLKGRRRSDRG